MGLSWRPSVFSVSPLPLLRINERAALSVWLLYSRLQLLLASRQPQPSSGNRPLAFELQTNASGLHCSDAIDNSPMESTHGPCARFSITWSNLATMGGNRGNRGLHKPFGIVPTSYKLADRGLSDLQVHKHRSSTETIAWATAEGAILFDDIGFSACLSFMVPSRVSAAFLVTGDFVGNPI
jgi:hypothetical protein